MKCFLKNAAGTILLLVGCIHLYAQAPDTAWTRVFGGYNMIQAYGLQQTDDGGYIITGYVDFGPGAEDVCLIKANSTGDSLWAKDYGEVGGEQGNGIQQTTDGGYIICGYTFGAGIRFVYLVKTDSTGDSLWAKVIGGGVGDQGNGVEQTTDGGYIITGWTDSYGAGGRDVYLIKTDTIGDTVWTKTFGGVSDEEGYSVQQTDDGGYIITGFTASFGGGRDLYLIKTDTVGDSLWAKIFGRAGSEYGRAVQQTNDGGYIIAGYTDSYSISGNDIYLIKTDTIGDSLWMKTIGGADDEEGYGVQQTDGGGYIITGYTDSYGAGYSDVYIVKTDSLGDTLWTKTVGGGSDDVGRSVQQTGDGGYIVAGYTRSYGAGNWQAYLIKLKPDVSGIDEEIIREGFTVSPAYPNPFTGKTTLSYELLEGTDVNVSVYNSLGQKIKELDSGKKITGIHTVTWDGTGVLGSIVPSGVYFLRVKVGGEEISRKVMFAR